MSVRLNATLARIVTESLENEDASGKKSQEVEHVFYGKISDPQQLAELAKQPWVTKVLQEQTQCQIQPKGADQPSTLRYRRINRESCVCTRKTFVPGQPGMSEETIECPIEQYEFFGHAFGEGMAKMRYVIKPDGWPKKLELDVFLDGNGNALGYAKFDYEVESAEETPPPLPITLTDLKHVNPFNSTDADRALLREFMQSMTFKFS